MAANPGAFTFEIFLRSFSSLNQLSDRVSGVFLLMYLSREVV
jgi:hypothetical protein